VQPYQFHYVVSYYTENVALYVFWFNFGQDVYVFIHNKGLITSEYYMTTLRLLQDGHDLVWTKNININEKQTTHKLCKIM